MNKDYRAGQINGYDQLVSNERVLKFSELEGIGINYKTPEKTQLPYDFDKDKGYRISPLQQIDSVNADNLGKVISLRNGGESSYRMAA